MQSLNPLFELSVQDRGIGGAAYRTILVFQIFIVVSLLALGTFAALASVDADFVLPPSSLCFVLLAYWTLYSWYKLHGTLFDPYPLFLISSWLFNGAQILLEVMQANRKGILGGRFSTETVLQTTYLVALAICAMHLSALLTSSGSTKASITMERPHSAWHTRSIGWALFAASIGPAIWTFREAGQMVIAGGYFSLYQRTFETGFASAPRLMANFLIPSALFLLAGSKGRRVAVILSAAIILLYAAGMFFIGSRAAASSALIAYLWLFSKVIWRIPPKLLLAPAFVVFFIVCPFIGAIRDTSGADRTSFEFMRNAWSAIDNPAVSALSEIGQSMSTVAHTLDLTPAVRPFDAGESYMYALLAALPNLGWEVHPAMAHGTLSTWLVRTVEPATAARGGGLGYSFIAESYINFGWAGVPIVMLAIGWGAGRLSSTLRRERDPAVIAMAATLLSFALIYARAETADFVRNICWYALVPFLIVRIASRVRT